MLYALKNTVKLHSHFVMGSRKIKSHSRYAFEYCELSVNGSILALIVMTWLEVFLGHVNLQKEIEVLHIQKY